ncbi:MAG: sigma-54-dependent Fis family transcriptional regulator [Deltaproteobacteria bacterium]|nr:sigma-54-dependent Fis family transcriptional regulator [Deltaproteobacteria bacterium]
MPSGKILVVDDDKNLVETVKMRLESVDYEVATALREEDALEAVKGQPFDLSIVDLRLVRQDGISLMQEFHAINPEMPVIILTGHGSIESAVEAMKRGAYSYVTKPFESRDLLLQIEKALEKRRLTSEVKRLKGLLEEKYDFANIVAKSDKMQEILETVSRIAKTDSTVYIHGESGTGKELIAKATHLASARKERPFVAINCAALPETLLESELFGHEKGAFTGAIRTTKGLFTQAHEGTVFLDEIGDMPASTQAKVLRVLQERQFYPLGSEKPVAVDVRVIVATKKELEEEVKSGAFREDLFFRIHVIPIRLPPLRERREDIPHLVDYFLKKLGHQMKKEIKGLTPQAMQRVMLYDWPGNVRELENAMEYAVAMTQQNVIGEQLILQTKSVPREAAGTVGTSEISQETLKPLKEARDAFEKDYICHLLQMSQGNVSQAAKLAGKYRADFYDLLKKHGLKADDFKKSK